MTPSFLPITLAFLEFFVVFVTAINVSGAAITTRFWDCCKPSCSWNGKAKFTQPVQTCGKDENPLTDFNLGTGCNGGQAYSCSDQQPWAVNDTFSYGFAGIYIQGHVEDFWCCACYQLDFTSDPLKGKTMVIQASNTAYDVSTTNRFSLAVPGGNTTSHDACASQFGVPQSVFGDENSGVKSKDDCGKLPKSLKAGCEWRFDWFQNAQYPNATFKRIQCPRELTNKTGCTRSDDNNIAAASSAATISTSAISIAAAMIVAGLLSA